MRNEAAAAHDPLLVLPIPAVPSRRMAALLFVDMQAVSQGGAASSPLALLLVDTLVVRKTRESRGAEGKQRHVWEGQ